LSASGSPPRLVPVREYLIGASSVRRNFFFFIFINFFNFLREPPPAPTCPRQSTCNRCVVRHAQSNFFYLFFFNFELERPPAPTLPCQSKWNRCVVRQAQSLFYFFLILSSSGPPPRPVPVRVNRIVASSGRRNRFFIFFFNFGL
jgi:hypothetical protein